MRKTVTRRSFLAGEQPAGSASLFIRTGAAAQGRAGFAFTHTTIRRRTVPSTSGCRRCGRPFEPRRAVAWTRRSFPLNNNVTGSDPTALKMLVSGEIQFFTLMGGVLGAAVPVAEIQQVPFAFRTAPHAHQAVDGALGAYILEEMAAKGIHGFPVGAFDNGSGTSCSFLETDCRAGGPERDAYARARRRDVRRHVPDARLRAGHDQQHRHLCGAQVRKGRRAGESARARRRVQAL